MNKLINIIDFFNLNNAGNIKKIKITPWNTMLFTK